MNQQINTKLAIGLIALFAVLTAGLTLIVNKMVDNLYENMVVVRPLAIKIAPAEIKEFKKFTSQQDFEEYLQKSAEASPVTLGIPAESKRGAEIMAEPPISSADRFAEATQGQGVGGGAPERFSETNVQVLGIDEPDIVKTNGKEIYFSKYQSYYYSPQPFIEGDVKIKSESIMPPRYQGGVQVIKAFPPEGLDKLGVIEESGNLLLSEKVLVVLSQDGKKVQGYDISNPSSPSKKWNLELSDRTYLLDARLNQGKVYLIMRNYVSYPRPCPMEPFMIDGKPAELKCVDVYHPVEIVPADTTYSVWVVDTQTGQIQNKTAFVGNADNSVFYMSEQNLYLTYSREANPAEFFAGFLEEDGKDLFPDWVRDKVRKILTYDISVESKTTELMMILGRYQNSLSEDDSLKMENEMENKMEDYAEKHIRDLEKTGIVKIKLENLSIDAVGDIVGTPLNQFSLDEYDGNLRVAVTIAGSNSMFGGIAESLNDVYILDKKMEVVGSVLDLGKGERIYSVRFLEDKGYVVTFKQVDPFYVLDLSNPLSPEKKGELKIPGYSSYLHPISSDKILGIGKEGSEVKLSLFDVENPSDPKEISKYLLKEYWTEVETTHHAFLLDKKHNVFFLPASQGGYVFSYKNDSLSLEKAVKENNVKRALYIDDYLYIVCENKIVVLNELNWERVKELDL